MPSGNKPLPELMLTQINVAMWRHYGTINSHTEAWKSAFLQTIFSNVLAWKKKGLFRFIFDW